MKNLVKLILFLMIAVSAYTQTTTVTATIQSPDGTLFTNSSVMATFLPTTGGIDCTPYKINGNPFPCTVSAITNGSGVLSIVLTDDHRIQPSGGLWTFTICSNSTAPCFSTVQDVFGATLNLTTLINAAAINPTGPSSPINKYYADSQVKHSTFGGDLYYNLTSNVPRIWNGVAWTNIGGGVTTFNGRSGSVVSILGDYPPPLISGFSAPNTSQTAPTPTGSHNPCVTGLNPFSWIQKSDGSYYPLQGVDTTTTQPNTTQTEHGYMTFCSNIWYNDTTLPQFVKNAALSLFHTAGNNTVDNLANDDDVVGIRRDNPTGYTAHARQQGIYLETGLDGIITGLGTCPDCGADAIRGVIDDETIGTSGNLGLMAAVEGSFQQGGTNNWASPLIGVYGNSQNSNISAHGQTYAGLFGSCQDFLVNGASTCFSYEARAGVQSDTTNGFYVQYYAVGMGPLEGINYNSYFSNGADNNLGVGTTILGSLSADLGTINSNGSIAISGALSTSQLVAPNFGNGSLSANTVGATTWAYVVCAVDTNGGSVCSSTGTISNGATPLNASPNFNVIHVSTAPLPGTELSDVDHYDIYRVTAGGTPNTTGKIGKIDCTLNQCPTDHKHVQIMTFNDTGLAASGSLPTTNTTGSIQGKILATSDDCTSNASPAVCGSAYSGTSAIPLGTNPTLVINTSAVSASNKIFLTEDQSLGSKLGVTCNTTIPTGAANVTARTVGTSFTIDIVGTFATNPICVSWFILGK